MDFLEMKITYNVKENTFNIDGTVKKEKYAEVIEEYLRGQLGAGEDKSPAIERDEYHITIKLYLEEDRFVIESDTGNKGLREGILIDVLNRLKE